VSLLRYSILVLALVLLSLAALAPLVPPGTGARPAVALGAALAAANTIAAHALACWSEGRSTRAFMGALLGGMVGRMALLLLAVVAGVLGFGLPRLPLVFSLLGYFTLFMVLELAVQHRRLAQAAR